MHEKKKKRERRACAQQMYMCSVRVIDLQCVCTNSAHRDWDVESKAHKAS